MQHSPATTRSGAAASNESTRQRRPLGQRLLAQFMGLLMIAGVVVGIQSTMAEAESTKLYLPYPGGKSYIVTQGWGGGTSHQSDFSRYAVDFAMPQGSAVTSSAAGTVQTAATGCNGYRSDRYCNGGAGNYVVVKHTSSLCSYYFHLQDVSVRPGQSVAAGGQIGRSGTSGWSTGPHLHFKVSNCANQNAKTFRFVEQSDLNNKTVLWRRLVSKAPKPGAQTTTASNAFALPYPKGKTYTVSQGWNNNTNRGKTGKYTLNFALPYGATASASKAGTVKVALGGCNANRRNDSCNGGLGNFVVVDHGRGTCTQYSHLSRLMVKQGQRVAVGKHLGKSGASGGVSGPTLDFRVTGCNYYSKSFTLHGYSGSLDDRTIAGVRLPLAADLTAANVDAVHTTKYKVVGTGGIGLNVRAAAASNSTYKGNVKDNQKLSIICQVRDGENVYGSTVGRARYNWAVWNKVKLTNGTVGYASDIWTNVPQNGGGIPTCDNSGADTGTRISATSTNVPSDASSYAKANISTQMLGVYGSASAACNGLHWSVLAGIGKVESHHGQIYDTRVASNGSTSPKIFGIVLDGRRLNGERTYAIRDTDGGRLDGNRVWDRAVGPMQFIPTSWAKYGVDGNKDGVKDPHNVYDAVPAAARHLCPSGSVGNVRTALYNYNQSSQYVNEVLTWAKRYRA